MTTENELDAGMKCIKYMLCVANLMFSVVGLLLICIGFTVKGIYTNFNQFMETYYYNPATLAIVIGFFIFLVAFFGCIGALKESTFLVNTYGFLLTLVLVLEISASIAAYAMRPSISYNLARNMEYAMNSFNVDYNAYTWNAAQLNLQCCGIHKCTEWNKYNATAYGLVSIKINDTTTLTVPPTCCLDENCSSSTVYKDGCLDRITDIISQCALLLAVGALSVSFIQVLGIVFASMLAKSIRSIKTQRLVTRDEVSRNFYKQMIKDREVKPKSPELYTPNDSEA